MQSACQIRQIMVQHLKIGQINGILKSLTENGRLCIFTMLSICHDSLYTLHDCMIPDMIEESHHI